MRLTPFLVLASLLIPASRGNSQQSPQISSISPLAFEPNLGQAPPDIDFLAHTSIGSIYVDDASVTYGIPDRGSSTRRTVQIRWTGANPAASIQPAAPLPGKSNYLFGKDSSRWIRNVPRYQELQESGLLPGIDIRYRVSNGGDLEYDLLVAPQASLSNVRFTVEGADHLQIGKDGSLSFRLPSGEFTLPVPHAYELREGRQSSVSVAYVLQSPNTVSFRASARTPKANLVVDPVVKYATYFGSNARQDGLFNAITNGLSTALDPAGNVFIAGTTTSIDLPVTPGALMKTCPLSDTCDITPAYFVAKFSAAGQLLYSTYLAAQGLSSSSDAPGETNVGKLLAVDRNGRAYFVGGVYSWGSFPTTPNAFQVDCQQKIRATCSFLAELNGDGSGLIYSTFFGGPDSTINGITLGQNGDAYIAGHTSDLSLPTTPGAHQYACPLDSSGNCQSGFVARINTRASGVASLVFSTYLGADGGDSSAAGIAVDKYGDVYVTGVSTVNFPGAFLYGSSLFPPAYRRGHLTLENARTFIAKLDGRYGQFLHQVDMLQGATGTAIAVDNNLNTYVAGSTASDGIPYPGNGYQPNFGGKYTDAFVAKFDPGGYALTATYLGGTEDDFATDIAVNSAGMPFVTGYSFSPNFPSTKGSFGKNTPGYPTVFITALASDLTAPYYSSLFSRTWGIPGSGIALDSQSNAYLVSSTTFQDFPATSNAFQKTLKGGINAFWAAIVVAADLRAFLTPSAATVKNSNVVIFHARVTNYGPDASSNLVFTSAIPVGMSYAGVYLPAGANCSEPQPGATSGTLTCKNVRLESGQSWYINIYLRAIGTGGSTVTDTVNVTAQTQDLVPANNSASATVQIQ